MNDVIDMLSEFRAGDELDAAAVGRARNEFLRGLGESRPRRSARTTRRWAAVALAGAALAAAALVFTLPGADVTQPATAADLRNVANVAAAAEQPPAQLGRGQFVLTRYRFLATTTTTYTQEKLDLLSREAYERVISTPGHPVFPKGTPQSTIDRQERLESAWKRRIKRGVRLEDLPASTVTVSQSQSMAEWINERHQGAGGGLEGGKTEYGGAGQRGTVKRLERAGIYVGPSMLFESTVLSEPVRFENYTWPSAELVKLPTRPDELERRLRAKPLPFPNVRDGRAVASDAELFHASVGLLRSPFASPQLRSAVVLMLGGLDGVQLTKNVADAEGRRGLGLALDSSPVVEEVVFDEQNSAVLGVNFTIEDPSKLTDTSSVATTVADRGSYQVVFEPTIVVQGEPICPVNAGVEMEGSTYCEKNVKPVSAGAKPN